MHIEFHTPAGEIKEWLIEHLKEQLVQFHHYEPAISRAQVYFRHSEVDGKICEIDIPIFGSSIFIHRVSSSYEQSMREVLQELKIMVIERYESRKDLPDEVISSIEVEPSSGEEQQ
jgi:putative sigma-54 modulation protein